MSTAQAITPPVLRLLDDLHVRFAAVDEGEVATYIPELAKADPSLFGIAIVTLDGHVYTAGDCDVPFTLQSISKPFVYGLALEDRGSDYVIRRVGLEPTGDAFNAISLDPDTGRPSNPMINAGAIATTSLIEHGESDAMTRILKMFSRYSGRQLEIDEAVYRSESETGHRNRAISHMLRNFDIVEADPEIGLDRYFRQCSILVTCRDIAIMAATMANRGVNPITGERALDPLYVDSVLSIMGSCGMYNYAGEWIYRVGMPAKSGVSGGVLACLPGQIGIGVFSPPLDARGNSRRGVLVCDELSHEYKLHTYNAPNVSRASVRARYNVVAVRSKRQRRMPENVLLTTHGERVRVYELQGHLNFASVEAVSRTVVEDAASAEYMAFDFKRVLRVDPGAVALLLDLLKTLLNGGIRVVLSDAEHVNSLAPVVEKLEQDESRLTLAENLDRAIESCEDQLLRSLGANSEVVDTVPAAESDLFAGIEPSIVERILAYSRLVFSAPGELLISARSPSTRLCLLVRGEVSATVDLPYQEHVRLATYSPGMAFGYRALVADESDETDFWADTDVEFCEIELRHLEDLANSDAVLRAALFRNVATHLVRQLSSAASEIQALSL